MIKLLTLLLTIIIVISNVSASTATIKATVDGATGGALIVHNSHSTESSGADLGFISGNENYQQNTAGTHIVTLGNSQYSEVTKINNQYRNTYDISNELLYSGQAALGNQYSMTDNKAYIPELECNAGNMPYGASVGPNGTLITDSQNPSYQSTTVQYSGTTAGGGRYKTGGVVDDANLTTSMRAEGNLGGVSVNYFDTVEAGFNSSSNEMNFRKQDYGHYSAYDYNGSGYYLPFDFEHKDYSNVFETEPVNESLVVNDKVGALNSDIVFSEAVDSVGNESVVNESLTTDQ